MRYAGAPAGSSRSNLPPMLGGPSCPPRNMTDRSATVPLVCRTPLVRRHKPDFSLVGTPIAKCISTVRVDDPSPNSASASRRSPFLVPRNCLRVNEDRLSRPLRSSTGGFGGWAHDARRTATKQRDRRTHAILAVITLCYVRAAGFPCEGR